MSTHLKDRPPPRRRQGWAEARVKLLTGGDPVTTRCVGRNNRTLEVRLRVEGPAILRWLIEGSLD